MVAGLGPLRMTQRSTRLCPGELHTPQAGTRGRSMSSWVAFLCRMWWIEFLQHDSDTSCNSATVQTTDLQPQPCREAMHTFEECEPEPLAFKFEALAPKLATMTAANLVKLELLYCQ